MKRIRFGLIGHPIAHSLSPALFKAGYGGAYPYDLIEGEDFEKSYQIFLDRYDGINVTAPFKELAFAKADILSDECLLIKAVNLLIKTPEGVKAYNSDYLGVRMWLSEVIAGHMNSSASDMEGQESVTVMIAGCGGAGKAAAIAAASLGLRVILLNRNMEKAEDIAASIRTMTGAPEAEVRPLDDFRKCFRKADIIIYNIPTSIPALNELDETDFHGQSRTEEHRQKFILEANYKDPSFDNLLIDKMMNANPHIHYTRGQKWLLYQAVTGYRIFTGDTPNLTAMEAVI